MIEIISEEVETLTNVNYLKESSHFVPKMNPVESDFNLSTTTVREEIDKASKPSESFVKKTKVNVQSLIDVPIYNFVRENTMFSNFTERFVLLKQSLDQHQWQLFGSKKHSMC